MAAPDYDWEMDASLKAAVSCVSLGSYCAVAAALNHLKLRTAAYPFDWNRTTLEGVIHFLENRFSDFLSFLSVKDFPGGKHTGGKAYCGVHHSVWHEDLATEEGNEKYRRRISRFYENVAPRILFIRCMNASSELGNAHTLLAVLQRLFAGSQVYVLLIAVCQQTTQSFLMEGTAGRLLVHCTPQWSVDGTLYTGPIRAAYTHAAASSQMLGLDVPEPRAADGRPFFAPKSFADVMQAVHPYFGGMPQQVPFSPQPLYIPPNAAVTWAKSPCSLRVPLPQTAPTVYAVVPRVVGGAIVWMQGAEAALTMPGDRADDPDRGEAPTAVSTASSAASPMPSPASSSTAPANTTLAPATPATHAAAPSAVFAAPAQRLRPMVVKFPSGKQVLPSSLCQRSKSPSRQPLRVIVTPQQHQQQQQQQQQRA
mmetsp:Transcript_20202/g.57795  ORF Transcript_20202/g.57795 Transcript_20202/m.57795 type:complete len:424 (+) Transcript_20202:86-1357(+)